MGDDPGGGGFPTSFVPTPGAFGKLMCPHPEEFPILLEKMLICPGVSPTGGGGGTADVDCDVWAIYKFMFSIGLALQNGMISNLSEGTKHIL